MSGDNTERETSSSQNVFLDCVRQLLRPVLKFCLRHSVQLPDIIECCKVAFVELAAEQLKSAEAGISISRIGVMTGITRREVTRIYQDGERREGLVSLPTKVLGQWQGDKRFMTPLGKPRVLSLGAENSEFAELVASVSSDLNPYTLLYELERIGAVERTPQGAKLVKFVFGSHEVQEIAKMMALDATDLMEAIHENTNRKKDEAANYHIVTEYDNIAHEAVPQIRSWILKEGTKFHARLRKYLSKFDCDINRNLPEQPAGVRVAVGGFGRVVLPSAGAESQSGDAA